MDVFELIRNAQSTPEVLSALSSYVESLRNVAVIPDWCLRLPLKGEDDVAQRTAALFAVVSLASQNLRHRDCDLAKRALRVFAVAASRLRQR